jgi:hypothetical protein
LESIGKENEYARLTESFARSRVNRTDPEGSGSPAGFVTWPPIVPEVWARADRRGTIPHRRRVKSQRLTGRSRMRFAMRPSYAGIVGI